MGSVSRRVSRNRRENTTGRRGKAFSRSSGEGREAKDTSLATLPELEQQGLLRGMLTLLRRFAGVVGNGLTT